MSIGRVSLVVVLLLGGHVAAAEHAIVLVADADSPINDISPLDVRKAYLGISTVVDGHRVRAVRRKDNGRLNQVFLQSVVAMSRRTYDRRLLSLVLKFGTPRPTVADGTDELLAILARSPTSISYMWKSEAETNPQLKIIRVLWQDH